MNNIFRKHLKIIVSTAVFIILFFSTSVSAKVGTTGTEYNSKGTITDESSINIDSTDIYTLDNAIEANNKTLENYSVTAGDIYNNLSAIDSAVAKAKAEIAQNLEDMNIYVSRNDAGAINSHAGTTDWVGTTTAAKSAAVANYTLEELIGQMKVSVTGSGSEMTAKINAGDFKSKSATSSITSGTQTVNLSGRTEINLDKNQQVVLPSGYYGNGMTINNVISGETLNWNPSGKATLVIDRPYTSGTISTSNAYNAGYDNGSRAGYEKGKDDTIRSVSPSYACSPIVLTKKRSFSFNTTSGSCYIVDMMLTGYYDAGKCSISGAGVITSYQNHLSRRDDCWITNILYIIRANGGSVTITLNGDELPELGEHGFDSQACIMKII